MTRAGIDACSQFLKAINRVTDGAVTSVYGIELEMRTVYSTAERSTDPVLRQKAGELVRRAAAIRNQGSTAITRAAEDFADYCKDSVLRGRQGGTIIYGPGSTPAPPDQTPSRPSRPISSEEVERQLKAMLEREGAQNTKCTKKQYGSGWLTVCE